MSHENLSPLAQTIDRFVAAGYHPIPIMPRDKAPGEYQGDLQTGRWTLAYGWNDYAKRAPSEASVHRWKSWPDANIGVVLGTPVGGYQLIAIDFDTDDHDELEMLKAQLPTSRMQKKGYRGFTAFYRASKDVKTKRYMIADPAPGAPAKKRCVLEILTGNAPRQTVVPPSWHPNSGKEYEWLTGDGIVPIVDLPVLSDHHFEALEDTLEHLGWNGDTAAPVRDRANRETALDTDDPNIWRETNNIALQKFDLWVRDLGLPKLKRHPNGSWEAVPTWRPSNEGRQTMQRKANLKFHRHGIKDMGVDAGYTPLDVVCAAFGWDLDTSFKWLRGKLGLDDDSGPLPDRPRQLVEATNGVIADAATGEIVPSRPSRSREFPDRLTRVPGLLGEMVEHIVETSRRPVRALALASALVCLGTIIGRRDATPTGSGTHLYAIALAPTGAGKEHPQRAGELLIETATTGHGVSLIGASEHMSQTALIREMEGQSLSASFIDEFGAFLKRVNAPKAAPHDMGIKKVLLTAWGMSFSTFRTPAWADTASKTIRSPAVSIFGASTPAQFYAALQGEDRENGFLNRTLLFATDKKEAVKDPEYDFRDVPSGLVDKLQEAYRVRRSPFDDHPTMHLIEWEDGRAKAACDEFQVECEAVKGTAADYFVRSAEMAGRLATILAVGRNVEFPTVALEDIRWGIDVARWSAQRMAKDAGDFIADTQVGRDRARILTKLNASPDGRVAASDVMRDLGFKSRELKEHIRDLVDMDVVLEEIVTPATGGRPKHFLVAA